MVGENYLPTSCPLISTHTHAVTFCLALAHHTYTHTHKFKMFLVFWFQYYIKKFKWLDPRCSSFETFHIWKISSWGPEFVYIPHRPTYRLASYLRLQNGIILHPFHVPKRTFFLHPNPISRKYGWQKRKDHVTKGNKDSCGRSSKRKHLVLADYV